MSQERAEIFEDNTNILTIVRHLAGASWTQTINFGCGTYDLIKQQVPFNSADVAEFIDITYERFWQHPILGLGLLGCSLICVIPIVFFITLIVASVLAGISAFLIIEILILACICLFMVPFIIAIVMPMSLAAAFMVVAYFSVLSVKRQFIDPLPLSRD